MTIRNAVFGRVPTSSMITSSQDFSIAMAAAATGSYTLPIPVDASRAIVNFGSETSTVSGNTAANEVNGKMSLASDGLSVAASKILAGSGTTTLYGRTVEFNPVFMESVQRFDVTIAAGNTNSLTNIPVAVDSSRSFINLVGWTVGAAVAQGSQNPGVKLATASGGNWTQVSATKGNSGQDLVAHVEVVLLRPGIAKSIEQIIVQTTTTNLTGTGTLATPIDWNHAFMINNGSVTSLSSATITSWSATLGFSSDGQTITATRVGSTSTTNSYYLTVLQLKPGIMKRIQRYLKAITGANTTADQALSPVVDPTKVMFSHLGYSTGGTTPPAMIAAGVIANNNSRIYRTAVSGTSTESIAVAEVQ